ncbi:hypothetical protein [Gordonia shandongensis]|uniref:hypothetical protein n=1 Tax=Gordonia shandongensis TaxID=376351 RepID=UPI000409E241|nr:hypothetical protein [Gordonia shandongensis]
MTGSNDPKANDDAAAADRGPARYLFPWFLILLAAGAALTLPSPTSGLGVVVALGAGAVVAAIQSTARDRG